MPLRQVATRLSDQSLAALDRKTRRRRVSRSQIIREAIESYVHDEIEAEIDRSIVEGYTRFPQLGSLREEELAYGSEPWG
jgi:metal-responsive CopG/Arc/MetJ family transcriptional regulator